MNSFHNHQPIYGSVLVDELHNYFPEILYNRTRFTNVQDLLNYMNYEINARFNPYQRGLMQYRNNNPRPDNQTQSQSIPTIPASTTPANPVRRRADDLIYYYQVPSRAAGQVTVNSIFRELLQEFDQPVPVVPSPEVINRATSIIAFNDTMDSVESCAICQENYEEGEEVRKINHCTHYFHKTCIDSWFLTSVRCPVCRHDVRQT